MESMTQPKRRGRPRKVRKPLKINAEKPLEFLLKVMHDENAEPVLRVRAAIAAAQYTHVRLQDGGKKEARQEAASEAQAGAFVAADEPNVKRVH